MKWLNTQKNCWESNIITTQQISLPPRNEEQIDSNSLRNPSTPKPILITLRQPKGTIPPTDPNPEGDPILKEVHFNLSISQVQWKEVVKETSMVIIFHPFTHRILFPITWNKIPIKVPNAETIPV